MRTRSQQLFEKRLARIVGNRIRALRNAHRWNQVDLEAELNGAVVRSTIGNFETGSRLPSLFVLGEMARVFGVPMASFLLDPNGSERERAALAVLDVPERTRSESVALAAEKRAERKKMR